MKKLGLAITEPSLSTIKIADQGICKPIRRIRDLKVSTGGEDYHLTFEVLPMRAESSAQVKVWPIGVPRNPPSLMAHPIIERRYKFIRL
jgi:hypothetical protein